MEQRGGGHKRAVWRDTDACPIIEILALRNFLRGRNRIKTNE